MSITDALAAAPWWVWAVALLIVGPPIAYLLWSFSTKGGKLKVIGKSFFYYPNHIEISGATFNYVQRSLGHVEHALYGRYLHELERRGAPVEHVTEFEDAMYLKQLLHSIIFLGNGSKSFLQIIMYELQTGDFLTADVSRYVRNEILPLFIRSAFEYLRTEYYSSVLQKDGSRRDRWLTESEIEDLIKDPETLDLLQPLIENIFRYAFMKEFRKRFDVKKAHPSLRESKDGRFAEDIVK